MTDNLQHCPHCGHTIETPPQQIQQQVELWRELLPRAGLHIGLGDLVSERTAAKLLDRSPGTLRNWRSGLSGPRTTPIGHGQVRYRLHDLAEFIFTTCHDL